MIDDQVEQRRHIAAPVVEFLHGPAFLGGGVEHGELKLFFGGVECGEQVEGLVQHPVRAAVGLVDLVDQHDRTDAEGQRLGQHELGLRHRAFSGVDQQHHTVDHRQDALDLTAEVGVTRGVDDVDTGVLPLDRGDLGEDGDAALALDVVGVHGAFGHALVFAELAGLLQQAIHQRGLAMVNVRDDRDVAQDLSHQGVPLSLRPGWVGKGSLAGCGQDKKTDKVSMWGGRSSEKPRPGRVLRWVLTPRNAAVNALKRKAYAR